MYCDAKSATSSIKGMGLILTGYLPQLVPRADAYDIERFELVVSGERLQVNGVHDHHQAGLETEIETER